MRSAKWFITSNGQSETFFAPATWDARQVANCWEESHYGYYVDAIEYSGEVYDG